GGKSTPPAPTTGSSHHPTSTPTSNRDPCPANPAHSTTPTASTTSGTDNPCPPDRAGAAINAERHVISVPQRPMHQHHSTTAPQHHSDAARPCRGRTNTSNLAPMIDRARLA